MNIYDSNIGCQLWILSGKLKKNNMNLFYFFESGGIDGYTVYKWTTDLMIVIGNFGKFVHATTGMIIRTGEYEKLYRMCVIFMFLSGYHISIYTALYYIHYYFQ